MPDNKPIVNKIKPAIREYMFILSINSSGGICSEIRL